ncbi:uncharacterized protein E6C27_scaffold65G00480 [Cucumis melo var. makuwa]|uniref:Uncharacterized protein n=2 Tax=Cucumis melo TaxID=3656 RepID=A0A5A7SSJ3_CUCMM|nr:uncharacterized protein E6C27_scaffold65G00480 [Cucumis melo var. makuwa]
MALQSDHPPTGAGDDEAAARNYLSRKKPKVPPPISPSSDFESRPSTTIATVCNCNLTPSETTRITQQFIHSLIARVVGKDTRPGQLAARLRHHLRLTQDVKVFELGLGYFVLKFSETDYLALEDLPWSIPNLCIHAFPWTPDFKPSEAINSSVNVWIRLPELSIEYYDVEILKRIADAIGGRLVKIDPVTRDRWKCKFARFCISVNLCDPLPSMIELGRIRQRIEYEGFELCAKCNRVGDLRHDCSSLNNPSGSYGFNPHGDEPHHSVTRYFKEFGSTSSSKQPLIPESSRVSAWESSRFIEKNPQLDLKSINWPNLPKSESGKAGTSVRISSPHVHVKDKAIPKKKEKCEISVQPLPSLPKQQSSTITIKAPELKCVVPSVVEDQLKDAKTINSTMIADHNSQPPSPTASIPFLQPSPASEATLKFLSDAILCLTRKEEICNSPSKETNDSSFPTVYTIDPKKITSLNISLSEVQTTSMSNQNQYTIELVPTMKGGDKGGVGLEVESGSEPCAKKMLVWKFHAMDNAKLMRALKDLIQLHEPSIVLIFGNKITGVDAVKVMQELAFCGSYSSRPDGYNGGVWLLLSKQDVQTKVNSYSPQQVSASVTFHSETNVQPFSPSNADTETSSGPWGSTFFYTSTNWMTSLAY